MTKKRKCWIHDWHTHAKKAFKPKEIWNDSQALAFMVTMVYFVVVVAFVGKLGWWSLLLGSVGTVTVNLISVMFFSNYLYYRIPRDRSCLKCGQIKLGYQKYLDKQRRLQRLAQDRQELIASADTLYETFLDLREKGKA